MSLQLPPRESGWKSETHRNPPPVSRVVGGLLVQPRPGVIHGFFGCLFLVQRMDEPREGRTVIEMSRVQIGGICRETSVMQTANDRSTDLM